MKKMFIYILSTFFVEIKLMFIEYSWNAGTLRWKAVECNCIYVQSSGNGWTAVFAVGTKRKCFVLCAHAAFANAAGKAIVLRPDLNGIAFLSFCRKHSKPIIFIWKML